MLSNIATKFGFPSAQPALSARAVPTESVLGVDSQLAPSGLHSDTSLAVAAQVEAARREMMSGKVIFIDAAVHARRLLEHLKAPDPAWPEGLSGEIRSSFAQAVYNDLCTEAGWATLPWQRVGQELRKLTGGGRHYRSFWDASGRRQRLAVFRLPSAEGSDRQSHPTASERAVVVRAA